MNSKLIAITSSLFPIWLGAIAVLADTPESRVSVPVTVDLNGLRAFVESKLPANPLYRNEYGRTCVEPERVCTKVPEFRGLKVTMKNRCVEVTPRIECTITEQIDRQNAVEIGGEGGAIVIRQDIFGSGTVRGRGEIGKNIRQTVRAAAEFSVTASPVLNADWSVSAETSITKRWLQRPEFKLFNMFPVTIGSQIDPALDAAMRQFEAEVPMVLARLSVKQDAEALWLSIQDPVPLVLDEDRVAYLHLRPTAVSFHGVNISGSKLTTGLSLSLQAMADFTADGPDKVLLPNLTDLPDAGVNVTVPVHLDFETLSGWATELLPFETRVEGQSVSIKSAHVGTDGASLVFNLDVEVEDGILARLSGPLDVRAVPILESETQLLVLNDIKVAGVAGQTSFLRDAALKIANGFIQDRFEKSLVADMDVLSQKLTEALNGPLSDEFRLSGTGEVSLAGISLSERADSLTATFMASGRVNVTGFDPFR